MAAGGPGKDIFDPLGLAGNHTSGGANDNSNTKTGGLFGKRDEQVISPPNARGDARGNNFSNKRAVTKHRNEPPKEELAEDPFDQLMNQNSAIPQKLPQKQATGGGLFNKPPVQIEQPEVTNDLTSLANLPPPVSVKQQAANAPAASFDDDGWGDWNFDDLDKPSKDNADEAQAYKAGIDIDSRQYQHENLNKLSDKDLALRKRHMDKDFDRNFVKPTDAGFVYDKVVDFKVRKSGGSWESSGEYSDDWNE